MSKTVKAITTEDGGVVTLLSQEAYDILTAGDFENKPGTPAFEKYRTAARQCTIVRFGTEHEDADLQKMAEIVRNPDGLGRA